MIYRIKKGKHDGTFLPRFTCKERLAYDVTFPFSCKYETRQSKNAKDINKLFGFTDGLRHVHQSSARFGWLYNNEKEVIELYYYCYVDGKRLSRSFGAVKINERVNLELIRTKNNYRFFMNGKFVAAILKEKSTSPLISVKLLPYFGGDEKAPHDIFIYMNQIL